MCRAYVAKKSTKWEQYPPLSIFAYNNCNYIQFFLIFLWDIQEMLHIARYNIRSTQDRARFYVNHGRHPRVLKCLPPNSKTLSYG